MPALIAAGDVLPPEPVQTRTRVVILVHPKDLPREHEKGMIGSNDEAPIAQNMSLRAVILRFWSDIIYICTVHYKNVIPS